MSPTPSKRRLHDVTRTPALTPRLAAGGPYLLRGLVPLQSVYLGGNPPPTQATPRGQAFHIYLDFS